MFNKRKKSRMNIIYRVTLTMLLSLLVCTSNTFANDKQYQSNHSEYFSECSDIFSNPDSSLNTRAARVRVTLKDGSLLIGQVLSENSDTVFFRSKGDIAISLPKISISKTEIVPEELDVLGFSFSDPNQSRLFFSPTAWTTPSGKVTFSDFELLFPFIGVGITDYFTLSGGFSLIPGVDNQVYYIAPKIKFVDVPNLKVSVGVIYGAVMEYTAGIAYSVASIGNERANLSCGLGYGFAGSKMSKQPILMVGGELRTSNNLKLITENWFTTEKDVSLMSAGIRFFGEHLSADFAFLFPVAGSSDGIGFIPWLGFAYCF